MNFWDHRIVEIIWGFWNSFSSLILFCQNTYKHGQKGQGKPLYLSSTICEEFIALIGKKVKQTIASEIQHAKYFSVIVDSTPDLSHVDQLTFIFRSVKLLESLRSFVGSLRDQFSAFEDTARTPSTTQSYQHDLTPARKRKSFSDESTENEVLLSGSEKYKVETFNVIIDRLISCLTKRTDAYRDITGLFGILFDMECDAQEVCSWTTTLISTYPEDLTNELADELIQLRHFVSSDDRPNFTDPCQLLQILLKNGLQTTFRNVFVTLRIFLTLPVTNCEEERSFSQMKRVKKELRTTMGQNRLTALSLMAIEYELVREMDFEDIIEAFATSKSRKRKIN
ncbi:hypothetical protein LDENG_00082200 [Lucifuga dentata]|nr:hypothetical protein LDENG_00082200 [Lucifuga dentata]